MNLFLEKANIVSFIDIYINHLTPFTNDRTGQHPLKKILTSRNDSYIDNRLLWMKLDRIS